MDSSDDETTDSDMLGKAYSLTDMLDELGSETNSGVTSPVQSELLASPTHQSVPVSPTNVNPTIDMSTSVTSTTDNVTTIVDSDTTTCGTTTDSDHTQFPPEAATCSADNIVNGQGEQGQPEIEACGDPGYLSVDSSGTNDVAGDQQTLNRSTDTTKCETLSSDKVCPVIARLSSQDDTNDTAIIKPIVECTEQEAEYPHTISNSNAKMVTEETPEVISDDGSDELVDSKSDPVWKRKKAIKRRKIKPALNSQSSTGSGESEGSTWSLLSGKGVSAETELAVSDNSCDITASNGNTLLIQNGDNALNNQLTANVNLGYKIKELAEYSGYEPYEFPSLIPESNSTYKTDDLYANIPDSKLYENINRHGADPRRSTLRRGATLKGLSQENLDCLVMQGSAKLVKVLPDEHNSNTRPHLLGYSEDGIYESLQRAPLSPISPRDEEYDDFSWGSSEFESYDDDEDIVQDAGQEPISVTVEVKSRAAQEPTNQNVLNKLAARIGPRSWSREDEPDSSMYLEVTLNMDKHPPPSLPTIPADLTPQQVKRRHIVGSIIESENSYTEALRRIIEHYEKPLLLAKPQIISKNNIKVIFYRLRDILQCHNMFHIELAENIRVWDTQEKLGNVFTASFSKSMVFDVYSEFVNNFTLAMETAKKLAKQKQAFADFLKQNIQNSADKLSLFGLMVKPVQRFPQFILCLQDLLKNTSRDHHDRLALQLALTELETLTHKLNEMKRQSENKHQVKKIQGAMTGSRFSFRQDPNRCHVRQDDMVQMDCNGTKTKARRLFLMNDQLICTTVVQKDGDTGMAEKFKFKWSIPIRDVEVVELDMPDLYQVQGGPSHSLIVAPKLDRSTFSPWKKELDDMMHDLAIIDQLANLTGQLRLNYPGLNSELLFNIERGLQLSIQDQSDLDLCILHLSLPTKFLQTSTDKIKQEMSKHIPHKTRTTRATRMLHTFQVQSASIKQDWLMDLKNTKLALDPNNKPGWYVPETEQGYCMRLPLFVKPLLIDITKQETKILSPTISRIQCAIPVVVPSYSNPYIGVHHLWVCSNDQRHGQVTVVKLHSNQPHVLESFTVYDSAIMCAEYVPGVSTRLNHVHAFTQDTVWMAMECKELCVRNVTEEDRDVHPLLVMDTDGDVTSLRFMDNRLYAGLADGRLAVYSRDEDGVWHIEDRLLVELGESTITGLLSLNHQMWVSCSNKVHIVRITSRWRAGATVQEVKTMDYEVGSCDEEVLCMVKAGVGLMVSFRGRGVIRIYNQETFNHLQDVNISSAVAQILEGRDLGDLGIKPRQVAITFLLASKGLLWVGTDSGCTLTLPLPRLEGVPQIKGRPSVSYHAHLGPIKFIVPIQCGPCQLHTQPTSPASPASPQNQMADQQSDTVSQTDEAHTFTIEGATESDTADSYEGEEGECIVSNVEADSESHAAVETFYREPIVHQSTSLLQLPHATIGRTKCTSTPDLRNHSDGTLGDSEEDVVHLYNNLIRGADYEHYDFELMGSGAKRKRRTQSDIGGYPCMVVDDAAKLVDGQHQQQWAGMGLRSNRHVNKYATLPIVMEDSLPQQAIIGGLQLDGELQLNNDIDIDGESNEADAVGVSGVGGTSPVLQNTQTETCVDFRRSPTLLRSPSGQSHTSLGTTQSPGNHRLTPGQKSLSKSVVIVTGGEGHINWADRNPGDTRYDDICLLLWQCPL